MPGMSSQVKKRHYSLQEIIEYYPLFYSEKRLDEWQGLFDERATIVRVEEGKPISSLNVVEAMPEQREYAEENRIFRETWDQVEIKQYGNIAVVKADYVLTTDHEIRKGIDILTLCFYEKGWRITNLTYEQKEFIVR